MAVTAAVLAFASPALLADKFDDSLAIAKANAATPAGRELERRVAERFDEKKLREALVDCAASAKEEDSGPFTVLLELSGDGRASQVLLRPPIPVAVCLRWTIRETAFPRPASPGTWVAVDVSPTRAPGVPPIPTAGVATASVPPTRTPAAPAAPPPPPTATPARPVPTPAPSLAATPAAPPVIDLAAVAAGGFHVDDRRPDLGELRRRLKEGRAELLGPLLAQSDGIAPDDPRLEPYWSLAGELDIPVAIQLGPEAPGAAASPRYRAALGDPLKLENVLVRHPKLRVVVSAAGWPMGDAMAALMWRYPQVFVDTRVIAGALPRAEFHAYLRRFVDTGFGERILFASGAPDGLDAVQSAEFLTAAQKRDILYGNAARFLRK